MGPLAGPDSFCLQTFFPLRERIHSSWDVRPLPPALPSVARWMLAASSLPNDCARADMSLEAACTAAVPKRITAEPPAPPCRGHAAMKRPRLRKGNLPGLFTITVGEGVFEKPRGSSIRAFSFHIQMSFPEPKLSLSSLPQGWAATAGSQHTWQTRSSSERPLEAAGASPWGVKSSCLGFLKGEDLFLCCQRTLCLQGEERIVGTQLR